MPGSQMFFNGKQLHLQKNVCLHLLSPCTECEILSNSDQRHKGFLGTGELAQWKHSMGWGIYIFWQLVHKPKHVSWSNQSALWKLSKVQEKCTFHIRLHVLPQHSMSFLWNNTSQGCWKDPQDPLDLHRGWRTLYFPKLSIWKQIPPTPLFPLETRSH